MKIKDLIAALETISHQPGVKAPDQKACASLAGRLGRYGLDDAGIEEFGDRVSALNSAKKPAKAPRAKADAAVIEHRASQVIAAWNAMDLDGLDATLGLTGTTAVVLKEVARRLDLPLPTQPGKAKKALLDGLAEFIRQGKRI